MLETNKRTEFNMDNADLPPVYQITLEFQAIETGVLPMGAGYILRGLLHQMLKTLDPIVFSNLQHAYTRPPYAIKPLYIHAYQSQQYLPATHEYQFQKADIFSFDLVVLGEKLSQQLVSTLIRGTSTAQDQVLHYLPIQLRNLSIKTIPWPAYKHVDGKYFLKFQTPTQFKNHNQKLVIYPEPAVMFKHLLRLWNVLVPEIPFSLEALEQLVKKHAYIRAHELSTRMFTFGKSQEQVGFQGWIQLILNVPQLSSPIKWLPHLLAFGQRLNIGYHRTAGMGVMHIDNPHLTY